MILSIEDDLGEIIRRKLEDLERSLEGRAKWAGYPIVCQTNREIGEEIETWTKTRLDSLLMGKQDIQSFAKTLARIHKEISGASEVRVKADARSIYMEVEGCSNSDTCKIRTRAGRLSGCLPDMIIAAILQRVMETPVRLEIGGDDRVCTKRFSPAWLVELLDDLDTVGGEGLVVLYRDRVIFSHLPSKLGAEALSKSVLYHEENPAGGRTLEVRGLTLRKRKILLMSLGEVFVSVCLRAGTPENRVRERIEDVIRRAVRTL